MYFFDVFSGTRPTKILGSACIFGKSLKPVVFSMKLGVLAETKSYTDSDVFWLIALILLIARTFVLIAEGFLHDGGAKKILSQEKKRASLRPPLRPSGPAVYSDAIFNLPPNRGKDVQLLSTEVRATQQNPRYSVKNNVAIRMIATFMPKYNEIFNCLLCLYAISSVQQILLIIF